ncbi:MAG: DNA-3-methyladenine glycosylase I [Alphaproteobacteria bacterium]|jgi:DNA-3-methyladenine glycosylase I|nr:DNA-3-methyladenine glycosylase I [Alphaproteobacteria bacterium]
MDSVHDIPCGWAPARDPLYRAYHDKEWGVPVREGEALFAKLMLDGMQAGLAWITILRKRETILEEFEGFAPERLARWDGPRIEKALTNPGIIRSRKKTEAIVGNARAFLDMAERGEDFADWCWGFVDGQPIDGRLDRWKNAPAKTELSETASKALRQRGFKFAGPVIVYAWMQAVGLVNDHETRCPRYREIRKTGG